MSRKLSSGFKITFGILLLFCYIALLVFLVQGHEIAILKPAGTIAIKQRNLLFFGALLSLLIVVPVFIMTFWIAWRYREGNKKARYEPEWDHSRVIETIWWTVPLAVISVLCVVTWRSSHDLDPFKPINSPQKPLVVQVIALEWKWLFIYPEQKIASLNFVQIPVNRPITFHITADAPMNSFWVPKLGGQMYAMSGMSTQLNLQANQIGSYFGSSANISGEGFAGMRFEVRSSSTLDFEKWIQLNQEEAPKLDVQAYEQLTKPNQNNTPVQYTLDYPSLYNDTISKFVRP